MPSGNRIFLGPALGSVWVSIFAYWACVSSSSAADIAAPQKYTLKRTIEYSLANSPSFDVARKTQEIRKLEYRSAIATLLPSLDFTATHGLQDSKTIGSNNTTVAGPTGAPWYSSLTLNASETLYDNGESLTKLSIANLNRDLAEVNYLKERDSLVLDVATQFYQFSLASILAEARQQQKAMLDKQYRSLTNQYQQGLKTRTDFLRFKTQVQRADLKLLTARNNVEQAKVELRRLMGASGAAASVEADFAALAVKAGSDVAVPKEPLPVERFYEYRSNALERAINDKAVSLSERRYWPQVSVTGGVTYSNSDYLGPGRNFGNNDLLGWNALLQLKYNLWDWGTRRRDVAIAEVTRDRQNDQLQQSLLDASAKARRLMLDLDRSYAGLKLSRELLSLEEDSYNDLDRQYREGKVGYLDIINGLENLLDAREQFFTNYFEILQNIARYQYYKGRLYETLAVE